jgi:hypothetical protein
VTAVRLTAPAAKALTVLHIVDASAPWVTDIHGGESTNGSTRCGIPMRTADSWQLLEQMPGESLCRACLGRPGAAPEQEALL